MIPSSGVRGGAPGAEKPNGFSETNLTNNLMLYPRGAAGFAWIFGLAGLG